MWYSLRPGLKVCCQERQELQLLQPPGTTENINSQLAAIHTLGVQIEKPCDCLLAALKCWRDISPLQLVSRSTQAGSLPQTCLFVVHSYAEGAALFENSPPCSGLLLKFPHSTGPRHCLGLLHPSQPSTWMLQSTSFNHFSSPGLTLWIWAFASFLTSDGYLLSCHLISVFTIL